MPLTAGRQSFSWFESMLQKFIALPPPSSTIINAALITHCTKALLTVLPICYSTLLAIQNSKTTMVFAFGYG